MAIEVKKREGESSGSLIYRFTKKIKQSGILQEAKKHMYHSRGQNRNQRRESALHREKKKKEILKKKKLGEL